jgi:ATP-dependent DNA helicase RecG
MKENQNIEWKESWQDEYIKVICSFANAQGGLLVVGVNDKREVTGIADGTKLLEEIPNKVRDILGIIVDINLKVNNKKEFLEIMVDPYPYPISYKGQYYYRSGSTKQELKGASLDRFLLQKQGKHWDGVPVPNASTNDLNDNTISFFKKKAVKSKRLTSDAIEEDKETVLKKLRLTEGDYLKRSAVLLFHPEPEMYVTGAYTKIGFFETDGDLLFHDVIRGNLFDQVERTMDLLLTKYLKANIDYEGLTRLEEYSYPEEALREVLLNAIVHKDYSTGNPVQISVYNNKIIFWNDGKLPEDWTIDDLMKKHPSKPFNPEIASMFFLSGLIEAWGRGIYKIFNECKKFNSPKPIFKYEFSGYFVEFPSKEFLRSGEKVGEKVGENLSDNQKAIIENINNKPQITAEQLAKIIGISTRKIEVNLKKLREKNIIERIGPSRGGYWKILNRN